MGVAPSVDRGARAKGPVGVAHCVIIGASQIARSRAADTIQHMPSAELSVLTSRDAKRGREFADAKDIASVETSLRASLRDPPMAEACDAAGVRLGGDHHMRGAAIHLAIRDLVRSGSVRFRLRRPAKRLTDVGMRSVGWRKMRWRC
jgi:predicted dehydrogenase